MRLYEPPRVRVADAVVPKSSISALVGALGIPRLMCLGTLYFITPVIAEGIALNLSGLSASDYAQVAASLLTITLVADLCWTRCS